MPKLDAAKIIKKVRTRLGVSQEGLSRRLNATKGAALACRGWSGNHQDLYRLARCARCVGRQAEPANQCSTPSSRKLWCRIVMPATDGHRAPGAVHCFKKENGRLRSQITRLESTMQKKGEQLRILEDLVSELQRQNAELKGPKSSA